MGDIISLDEVFEELSVNLEKTGIFAQKPSIEKIKRAQQNVSMLYDAELAQALWCEKNPKESDVLMLGDITGWIVTEYSIAQGAMIIRDDESLALKVVRALNGAPTFAPIPSGP